MKPVLYLLAMSLSASLVFGADLTGKWSLPLLPETAANPVRLLFI